MAEFNFDVRVTATFTVHADDKGAARAKLREVAGTAALPTEISVGRHAIEAAEDVHLSPAMTCYGIEPGTDAPPLLRDEPEPETAGERAARELLEGLGFSQEVGGGGSVFMSRYYDSGRYIWATGYQGSDMPATDDFLLCVYPAEECGESILDIDCDPEATERPSLQDAAAQAMALAAEGDPFDVPAYESDSAILYSFAGLEWTGRQQSIAIAAGWGISQAEGGGPLWIGADRENGRFGLGEDADAEAARHVAFAIEHAERPDNVHSARYVELCRAAAAIVDSSK